MSLIPVSLCYSTLLSLLIYGWTVTKLEAFVVTTPPSGPTLSRSSSFAPFCRHGVQQTRHIKGDPFGHVPRFDVSSSSSRLYNKNKNFVDEILDALDSLAGVSPLSEADLKVGNVDLSEVAEKRQAQAPPPDALDKPSVSLFFFLLGLIPCVVFVTAVKFGGIRPFGL